jgi:signal recognition particle receptor subunit beta
MNSIYIVILSGEDDQTQSLVSKLSGKVNKIKRASNIRDAASYISSIDTFLFLINYHTIVKSERKELMSLFKETKKTKFIVYAVPNDATRRLAFYRLGAYRILDDRFTIDDVYYFCLNVITGIPEDGKIQEPHFSGSLQDFNLAGLINIFGREKRSGILRIQTPVTSGKIFFNEGTIYHAVVGNLKEDDAVYYMLTWNKGWFSMRPLKIQSIQNKMRLSNVGLLLHSEQMRETFFNLINQLGGLSRQVKVVNQGDLLQSQKDSRFLDFIEGLRDFRELHEVIEFSPFSHIQTLNHLLQLKKTKNIEFRETAEEITDLYVEEKEDRVGLAEKLLSSEEVIQLRTNLNAQNISHGKLIILGTNTCGKTDFIRNLNQGSLSGVRTNQDLDFTRVELEKNFSLQVFGIAIDKKLTEIIEKLSEGLVGYVFLIDAGKSDEFEFMNYIINHLMSLYPAPWAAAITNLDKNNKKTEKKIQAKIRLPEIRDISICDVSDKEDVRKIILSMSASQYPEEKITEDKSDA